MTWSVSSTRADITPPVGYPLAGYATASGPRTCTGVSAPLHTTCLVLWDSTRPLVLVSADILGWPPSVAQRVRAALTAAGVTVPTADLVLAATHTHGGPVLPERLDPFTTYGMTGLAQVDAYTSTMVAAVVGVVQAALAAPRTPVSLDYATTSQSWSANREGLSYTETVVPVLVARRADGTPAAVVASYGTHPVCVGIGDQVDPDYPGVAAAVVEAAIPGCVALMVTGPAGDQDPVGTRGPALRTSCGAQLGAAVASAAMTPGRSLGGVLATRYSEVSLPLDITLTDPNLQAVQAAYATRLNDPVMMVRRHAQECIDLIDARGPYPTSIPLPVQSWRLAGSPQLRIAFIGGEPVSGYGVWLRNRYGGPSGVLVAGYANGQPCYVPSNALLPPLRSGGSYAGGWAPDQPGIAGGSLCAYGWPAHLRAGTGGAEDVLLAELRAHLD